jgi:hypothetical protein
MKANFMLILPTFEPKSPFIANYVANTFANSLPKICQFIRPCFIGALYQNGENVSK